MSETSPALPRFLRRPEVERATGLPRSSLYELVAKGEFPKPVRLSGRAVGWLETEVSAWLSSRITASRKAA